MTTEQMSALMKLASTVAEAETEARKHDIEVMSNYVVHVNGGRDAFDIQVDGEGLAHIHATH